MTQISTDKLNRKSQNESICHFAQSRRESGREMVHMAHLKAERKLHDD